MNHSHDSLVPKFFCLHPVNHSIAVNTSLYQGGGWGVESLRLRSAHIIIRSPLQADFLAEAVGFPPTLRFDGQANPRNPFSFSGFFRSCNYYESRRDPALGGRCRIRTCEKLAPLMVFKTIALDRSANLPPKAVTRPFPSTTHAPPTLVR